MSTAQLLNEMRSTMLLNYLFVIFCIRVTYCDVFVGGPSDVDPDTLQELRKNISDSFVQLQSEGKKSLQLKQIVGAQKQVVAGILYNAKTICEAEDGPKNCDISVWLKPWINFRQVSIQCENEEKLQVTKDDRPKRSLREEQTANLDADSDQSHFNQFKLNHGRNYKDTEEETMRFQIFRNNLYLIRQLNKFEQGTAVYGVTEFADLTQIEYFHRTGLLKRKDEFDNEIQNPLAEIPNIKLPKSHDWRDFDAITEVKNQGKGKYLFK